MDTTPLVDRDVEAGRQVVQTLDRAGFPVTVAFWYYIAEEDDWRLKIASPRVRERGPIKCYAAIRQALTDAGVEFPTLRLAVVGLKDRLVSALRIGAETDPAPFLGSHSLRHSGVGGAYVEGAYVYRAERFIGKNGVFQRWAATRDKARKAWIARKCQITMADGIFQKIEVDGASVLQRQTKHGLKARLRLLLYIEKRGRGYLGDVMQWDIERGKLRDSSIAGLGVRVEEYDEAQAVSLAT